MVLMRESIYQQKYAMEEYVCDRITSCCVTNTKYSDLYLVFITKLNTKSFLGSMETLSLEWFQEDIRKSRIFSLNPKARSKTEKRKVNLLFTTIS